MIVTISRTYGAAGHAVADGVAHRLGYRLVDRDLPTIVAHRLGTSAAAVDGMEEREASLGARILRSLAGAVPEIDAPVGGVVERETRAEIERAVREAAAAGNAVIVGRGAASILRDRTDLVRAFVTADLAWRAARIAAAHGVDLRTAREEIARVDAARRAYAEERYAMAWGTIAEYDVMVDVTRAGIAGAAEAIVAVVLAIAGGL